jgi:hypothetical protein
MSSIANKITITTRITGNTNFNYNLQKDSPMSIALGKNTLIEKSTES